MKKKPFVCAWCAKDPEVVKKGFTDEDGCYNLIGYRVECTSQFPHGHMMMGPTNETKDGAIDAWNNAEVK